MAIPKIIHYCFGMGEDFGGKPWSLVHHVCVRSAIENIRPDAIYFHYQYEPHSPWWDLTAPLVTKVRVETPKAIYGQPLRSVAHQADIVRLMKLMDVGGIYLDADVFVHKSFDPLLDNAMVLGQEGPDAHFGLANAVMLAAPRSVFLARWLDQYKWFRGGENNREPFWNEHSVQLPHFMARLFPQDVTVVDHLAFYWPLWIENHLKWLYESNIPIDLSHSYASHLWESAAWSYLKDATPGQIRARDTNFSRWVRPYVAGLSDGYGSADAAMVSEAVRLRA